MNNGQDLIDTRELKDFFELMTEEFISGYYENFGQDIDEVSQEEIDNMMDIEPSFTEEYVELRDFIEECEGYCSNFQYGATLIHESYFETYTEEFCKDLGYIDNDLPSWIEIDWSATADNLRPDYSGIEWGDQTYLTR